MQQNEIHEVFRLFDKDDDGFVTVRELAAVLRSLGQNPSESEIRAMVKYMRETHTWTSLTSPKRASTAEDYDPAAAIEPLDPMDIRHAFQRMQQDEMASVATKSSSGAIDADSSVSFSVFAHLVAAKVREVEQEEELKASLKCFEASEKPGFILWNSLRQAVAAWGEVLNSDELDELLKDADAAGMDENGMVPIDEFVRSIMAR